MINKDESTSLVPLKLRGESKHFPPSNKEWKNSVYLYNKTNLKSLPVKDNLALKLVKSFFNLHMEKTIARSKRMRSLIRKSTTKKLFVSRPEIKQTSDKVVLTVYTFDREKQFLFRRLYFKICKWEKFNRVNRRKTAVKFVTKVITKKRILHGNVGEETQNNRKKLVRKWKETRLVKQEPSQYKKLFRPKYFTEYDQWRHLNELSSVEKMESLNSKYLTTSDGLNKAKKASLDLTVKEPSAINTSISFKTKKNRLVYSLYKKDSLITRSIIIRKKNFYPLVTFNRIGLKKLWLEKTSRVKSYKRLLKRRSLMFIKKRVKVIKKRMPYYGFKHSNTANFLSFKVNNNRLKDAKRILVYFYIAYVLSLLRIKIVSFEDTLKVSAKKLKKLSKQDYDLLEKPRKEKNILSKKEKNILIKRKVPFYIRRGQKYKIPLNFGEKSFLDFYCRNKKFSISLNNCSFDSFVSFLLIYLRKMLIQSDLKAKISSHFKSFSANYFLDVFYKSLFFYNQAKDRSKLEKNLQKFNRDVLTINSFIKLAVNQTKFGKFLLPLKLLISKIYNKKVELNIVNLKSPHLNTDIFTEAVAIKLKKRIALLKVMRRSLQLVKIPSGFKKAAGTFKGQAINELKTLNLFKGLKLNNLKKNLAVKKVTGLNYSDSLQMMLKTLYPRTLTINPLMVNIKHRLSLQNLKDRRNNKKFNKLSTILNQVKYKWVTGVKLEAAGRLTRRYTAARSVFKFRQKGSLQNTDYSRKLDFLKNSMPNVLIRNLAKSNSQHTFLNSKKRIGAFGLKTQMSSY